MFIRLSHDRIALTCCSRFDCNSASHRLMKTSSIAVETSRSTSQSDSIVRQTNKRSFPRIVFFRNIILFSYTCIRAFCFLARYACMHIFAGGIKKVAQGKKFRKFKSYRKVASNLRRTLIIAPSIFIGEYL